MIPLALRKVLGVPESPGTASASVHREILDCLDVAVATFAPDGPYIEQNRRHRELLGYDDDTFRTLTPAADLGEPAFAELVQALDRSGLYDGPMVSEARGGMRVPVHITAFPVLDEHGTPVCNVLIKQDAAADAGMADKLRRSVSLLEATLDSTADGILVVDRAGSVVMHNRRFPQMWGIPEESLTGQDGQVLAEVMRRVKDSEGFGERVRELNEKPEGKSFDVIELADGRVFERYSRPQQLGDQVVGRVWSFRDVTQAAKAEAALRLSEERYRRLFEESRQAVYLTTHEGFFVDANPAALALFGLDRERMGGTNALDFYVDPAERATFQREIERTGSVIDYPVRLRSATGEVMDCVLATTLRRDRDGEIIGYQGIVENVTARRRAEQALRESERKFRSLIENASDTITLLDAQGTIIYESPSLERVLGYEPEDMIGQTVFDYVHPEDIEEVLQRFRHLVDTPNHTTTLELRFRHLDGRWRILDVVGQNLLHDETVQGIIVNARDVTERKEAEERLLHDAFHDKLTQLPNRALFMDRVAKILQRSAREDADDFAVLFLDMDRFKVVNDSLGHMIGDRLLVALAKRLEGTLRPGDTVARLGGDEFTMLIDGADLEEAAGVAERIQHDLETPFRLGAHQVYTTASIGIASSRGGYSAPEEILRDADLAMYRAKESGRARYALFDESMRDGVVELLRLETDLRQALEREELEVHYQPIIRLDTGELHGFEALIRWRHPERGLLGPAEFLNTAEETGLILPIGWWVLDRVCEQLSRWTALAGRRRPPSVQVNVSAVQLTRPELLERVSDAIERRGTPAELLILELTEGTMMENAESTVALLEDLKKLAIGLSIDDFGTGYSSLSYLHRFPTDSVKIDRSFVSRMSPLGRGSEIVRTIVELAHELGMHVVAEGIETEAHAALLRTMRCEFGQGFLYSKPLAPEQATELVGSARIW